MQNLGVLIGVPIAGVLVLLLIVAVLCSPRLRELLRSRVGFVRTVEVRNSNNNLKDAATDDQVQVVIDEQLSAAPAASADAPAASADAPVASADAPGADAPGADAPTDGLRI